MGRLVADSYERSPRTQSDHAGNNDDLEPGTKYAYSNFGYTLLGRVIEEISGIRYEEFIRREILNPAGIQRMAISGNSPGTALPGEVRYYDYPDAPLAPTIFAEGPNMLPAPYDMENRMMDAFGGWAASAIDLVRFSEAFDGTMSRAHSSIAVLRPRFTLQPRLIRALESQPPATDPKSAAT